VLRRISAQKRDDMVGRLVKIHTENLPYICSSPDITTVIRSRKMGWTGHVAHIRAMSYAYQILVEYVKGKRHIGRRSVMRGQRKY
jgi:hypothetical protein